MASERIQRRIDRLLDEADEAVSRFDWEAVRQRAEAVLAFDADNHEARAFLDAAEASVEGSASSALYESGISAESLKPSSDSPTFFANGRYQVTELLGEGGRKRSIEPTTLPSTATSPLLSSSPRAWTRPPVRE